jgi:hypothetical protein
LRPSRASPENRVSTFCSAMGNRLPNVRSNLYYYPWLPELANSQSISPQRTQRSRRRLVGFLPAFAFFIRLGCANVLSPNSSCLYFWPQSVPLYTVSGPRFTGGTQALDSPELPLTRSRS